MINSVSEFIEEFMKHKDKVEWYLHKPTPFADATDIRGRGVLCSPVTVMVEPPIHHSLDYLGFDVDITPSFQDVVSRASSHSMRGLWDAMEKFPAHKFPKARIAEAIELRQRLLDILGLAEEIPSAH